MKAEIQTKQYKEISLTSQTIFRAYFFLWWTKYTVLDFVRVYITRIPLIGQIGEAIIPIVMAVSLVLAIPYVAKRLWHKDLMFYMVCGFVVLVTMLLYPQNAGYIRSDLWRILGLALPAYFLGLSYDHEYLKKTVYWGSLVGVATMGAYQAYLLNIGRELATYNMDASYKVLPSILYLIYWSFKEKKLICWMMAITGILLCFSYGTRGPILIVVAYAAVQLFVRLVWNKRGAWRIVGATVLSVAVILLFTTNVLTNFAQFMGSTFEEIGLSTRIFDTFVEGEFTESTGRERIAESVMRSISDNLIFGTGYYGDRVAASGNYAHNIALELWCQFGVLLGTAVLLAILWVIISGFRYVRQADTRNMLFLFVCLVCIKLMLSGTYTTEVYFYFLLGICIQQRRKLTEDLS